MCHQTCSSAAKLH